MTRIDHLRSLKGRWAAQLEQLPHASEQRAHLIDALQDLDVLIQRLAQEAPDIRSEGPIDVRTPISMVV